MLNKIEELGYDNIYYSLKSTHEYVDQATAEARGGVAGFTMSMNTGALVLSKLEEFIRNKTIKIYSSRSFNEFRTFIWNNGKPQAMRSYHDDLIMSLAIVCWVKDTALTVSQRDTQYKKAMLDGMFLKSNKFNTTIKGQEGYKDNFETKYEEELSKTKKFAWIFKG